MTENDQRTVEEWSDLIGNAISRAVSEQKCTRAEFHGAAGEAGDDGTK